MSNLVVVIYSLIPQWISLAFFLVNQRVSQIIIDASEVWSSIHSFRVLQPIWIRSGEGGGFFLQQKGLKWLKRCFFSTCVSNIKWICSSFWGRLFPDGPTHSCTKSGVKRCWEKKWLRPERRVVWSRNPPSSDTLSLGLGKEKNKSSRSQKRCRKYTEIFRYLIYLWTPEKN